MPWQARTVNAIKGGRLSELIKEEGDCVVTVLRKILHHGGGREIGSADDVSIALPNVDEIGCLQKEKTLSLFQQIKESLGGVTGHFRFGTGHLARQKTCWMRVRRSWLKVSIFCIATAGT